MIGAWLGSARLGVGVGVGADTASPRVRKLCRFIGRSTAYGTASVRCGTKTISALRRSLPESTASL